MLSADNLMSGKRERAVGVGVQLVAIVDTAEERLSTLCAVFTKRLP